jgi:hypothetical protein
VGENPRAFSRWSALRRWLRHALVLAD